MEMMGIKRTGKALGPACEVTGFPAPRDRGQGRRGPSKMLLRWTPLDSADPIESPQDGSEQSLTHEDGPRCLGKVKISLGLIQIDR